jgi:formylglycine-generating enzyme required for sulfatase activity
MKHPACCRITTSSVFLFLVLIGFTGFSAGGWIDLDCVNDGDVTDDGDITAADAQQAFYIALGIYSPSYEEECAADCNGDGDVTSGDAQNIFLLVLSLSNCADLPPLPRYIYVRPGTFQRGSPESEPCRLEQEGPSHTVTLTRGFFMMTTEITREIWDNLKTTQPTLPDDPSDLETSPDMTHPVQNVTWQETILFANLFSLRSGYMRCYYTDATFDTPVDHTNYESITIFCDWNANGYRLPTEAEWEYAARAGTTGPFSFDEPAYFHDTCEECTAGVLPVMEQYTVYCATQPGSAEAVRSKLPSPWKLYDMHGNVWEWCWDRYDDYSAAHQEDPVGPDTGLTRIVRGGAWNGFARSCRSANRSSWTNLFRSKYVGFRLVRNAPG